MGSGDIRSTVENGKAERMFYDVDEVRKMLGISKSKAYAVIHSLNEELKGQGYITFAGKVNRNYFSRKVYGMAAENQE